MRPTEAFSGAALPDAHPWTPSVWKVGPDGLVNLAQQQLFADFNDVTSVLAGGDRAMAGQSTSPQNESDELINPESNSSSRAVNWKTCLNDLYRDEPLASWSDGVHDGPVNPAP